jgi:hypothetical protein
VLAVDSTNGMRTAVRQYSTGEIALSGVAPDALTRGTIPRTPDTCTRSTEAQMTAFSNLVQ